MNVLQISFTDIPATRHIPTSACNIPEFTTNTSISFSISIFITVLVICHIFLYFMLLLVRYRATIWLCEIRSLFTIKTNAILSS